MKLRARHSYYDYTYTDSMEQSYKRFFFLFIILVIARCYYLDNEHFERISKIFIHMTTMKVCHFNSISSGHTDVKFGKWISPLKANFISGFKSILSFIYRLQRCNRMSMTTTTRKILNKKSQTQNIK